jgi:outer membrane receptor protein involved in Fe transport
MKLKHLLITLFVLITSFAFAQYPGGGGGRSMNTNVGHIYGKIIDSISGKPMEYAVIEAFGYKYDTIKHSGRVTILTGDLTKANGDFSLENLPVMIDLTLKISALGYKPIERKFSFDIDMQKAMKQRGQSSAGSDQGGGMSSMLNMTDKDIGNIKLKPDVNTLKGVTIVSERPDVEIKLDKKIYNIEKNLTVTGGTAEDALKTIPSVTVDLDGNVSMRNASPQIFVDGRPSSLTIDQIPADAIESIEVISNPSAKYDASGGMAGIINIVLKKNKKTGYNGSIRTGVDMRGKVTAGGDFNVREGKVNMFISGALHQRKSLGTNTTYRDNLIGSPLTNIYQQDPSVMEGYFGMLRGGFDYFMNNRNTFTISGNAGIGIFHSTDDLSTRTDSLFPWHEGVSLTNRNNISDRHFQSLGASLLYKHLFPKEGRELTADLNYNSNVGTSKGNYATQYSDTTGMVYRTPVLQQQTGGSTSQFITAQTDFTTPLKTNMKIEAGLRASIKNYISSSNSYLFDPVANDYIQMKAFGVNYTFTDQVYAGYTTFSQEFKKFSYQAGLRMESSLYAGQFKDSTSKYMYTYPAVLFPNLAMTYHLDDKDDLQLSYSRRINRPNFFQLIPATDFSDSLNVKRGNPGLRPEFTNSLELSYLRMFNRSNTLMFSGFYKNSSDLITNYQLLEMNPVLHRNIIVNTYKNALSSNSYGAELTSKNSFSKILETTANFNLYYTIIDATNISPGLVNKRLNWFTRLSATLHLPKHFTLQLSGEYTAKSNLSLNSGGGGGRWGGMGGGMGGGGMMGGGPAGATAQGYSLPVYFIDAALKYEFLKDKKASLTLNAADILKTRIVKTHSESDYFTQDAARTKDQLFFRLTFSYRFGKFDVSLFKRKNTKMNSDGMQDMQM